MGGIGPRILGLAADETSPLRIAHDPRVRAVQWRDLTKLNTAEVIRELTLSLPWLALSLFFAHRGLYVPALAFSFMFFLAGLRQVHNAHHYALGLSRQATEWVMLALSLLMLGSMHAVQINHLRHHRHLMDEDDVEAISARMQWWQALLFGPMFPVLLHWKAFSVGSARQLRWVRAELAATFVLVSAAWMFASPHAFRYHVIAMLAGQCLTAFFAVWTVHHDCDRYHFIARTVRNRTKNVMTLSMFFHVEHHLFPGVPTCHLDVVAQRLDAAAPELSRMRVF
jgi:fatty acid desaturase